MTDTFSDGKQIRLFESGSIMRASDMPEPLKSDVLMLTLQCRVPCRSI